jgi:hypothetical protein
LILKLKKQIVGQGDAACICMIAMISLNLHERRLKLPPRSQWARAAYTTDHKPSQPPNPRPYKALDQSERKPWPAQESVAATAAPKRSSFVHRLFSLRDSPDPAQEHPKDIARGVQASQRVVREGVLDAKYKPAARRVTAIICALPIAIVTSYALYQRRFGGVEQKVRGQQDDVQDPVGKRFETTVTAG